MEVIQELFIRFGSEVLIGGIVVLVRWVEKSVMKRKFKKRLEEENKYNGGGIE